MPIPYKSHKKAHSSSNEIEEIANRMHDALRGMPSVNDLCLPISGYMQLPPRPFLKITKQPKKKTNLNLKSLFKLDSGCKDMR